MEHIVFSQIMNHLDDKNINFQHGFRSNHSCETQLLNTVEELSRRLDHRQTTDVLILDFSKAFDTVPHKRLLHKIQHYGIAGSTNKWIESWLCHRQQRVVLDGSTSFDSPVISGVPQGTVLGPLMFLLYVNDIANKVSPLTRIKLFADDCLLYRTISIVADQIQLQRDLDTLVDWSHIRLIKFNAAECHLLKITRKRSYIDTNYNSKYNH